MLTESRKIEEFICEYRRSRVFAEASVRATLNRALEFEQKFKNVFYKFTIDEVLTMYKSINAISDRSLQNVNLTLKHAARYILHTQKQDISNVYDDITKELIKSCVNTEKKEGLILDRDGLTSIQNELLNWTDKGILEMLFLGAGSNWLKELTFFDMSQVSRKESIVYFKTGKTIQITEEQYELIKNACEETELISFGETARISVVQSEGFYKIRCNALSANDDIHDDAAVERRFRFIQRRLMLISKDLGVQLTSGGLQTSGLLWHLKQGVNATGMQFREYVRTQEAIELARRYDIFSELAPQMLVEKFEKYFV